ncbi:hypothetical protein LTR95_003714 [Oleoguttula sp. CCFEE 5521]
MHVILSGATGKAGSAILQHALSSPSITRISVLSRRRVKLAEGQSKANVIIQDDFASYSSETLAQLKGAKGCVWALGISAVGMNEADYTKITYDYTLAAARAFAGLNDGGDFNFVFMSGEGANMEGKGQLFARVKGRTEKALLELKLPGLEVFNVRPAAIDDQGKGLMEREPGMMDRVGRVIGVVLKGVAPSFVISTDVLAKACLKLVMGDGRPLGEGKGVEAQGRLIRNVKLKELGA